MVLLWLWEEWNVLLDSENPVRVVLLSQSTKYLTVLFNFTETLQLCDARGSDDAGGLRCRGLLCRPEPWRLGFAFGNMFTEMDAVNSHEMRSSWCALNNETFYKVNKINYIKVIFALTLKHQAPELWLTPTVNNMAAKFKQKRTGSYCDTITVVALRHWQVRLDFSTNLVWKPPMM